VYVAFLSVVIVMVVLNNQSAFEFACDDCDVILIDGVKVREFISI